jgi:hypothetical protein
MCRTAILVLLSLMTSACAGSRRSSCESYFPSCERNAVRPPCEALTSPSGHPLAPDRLIGRVSLDDLSPFFGPDVPPDSFMVRAAEADAVWYYDGSGRMDDGMRIGQEVLVALRGCEVMAMFILVIYN